MATVEVSPVLKAPFPWFGGKSRVADIIWDAFGDVKNYVEPFAGSLAVLLGRKNFRQLDHIETVNDLDCYLANFWRAVAMAPDEVAKHADWPVNEADLTARHHWLVAQSDFRDRMKTDPEYYDARVAGWWVWGLSAWIGHGWCDVERAKKNKLPRLSRGCGVHGVARQMPRTSNFGNGVHAVGLADLQGYFAALQDRLRRVRVVCGDWRRVLSYSALDYNGTTGVFLDPPYSHDVRDDRLYSAESDCAADVRDWAIANGGNPNLRIALCGYDIEHELPSGWRCVRWKANGGYANQSNGRGEDNKHRECIWFSPYCLNAEAKTLFEDI